MADDIRAMTAELAADPTSLIFLELAEALRRRGQLDAAHKVTRNGLARYPELAAGHDLAARIFADRGELDRAFEAWVTALKHDPALLGAHKGLGFLYFRANDFASAEKHLAYVAEADPADAGAAAALERLRARSRGAGAQSRRAEEQKSTTPEWADAVPVHTEASAESEPSAPPLLGPLPFAFDSQSPSDESVFAGLEGGSDSLLLVDGNGLRLGGGLRSPGGEDVADAVAAQLAGVAKEAARTARLLALGEWRGVAIEAPGGSCYLVTPTPESLLFTARGAELPMGRVARLAERAAAAARRWLERMT